MNIDDYLIKLENFVNDNHSFNKELLDKIEYWSYLSPERANNPESENIRTHPLTYEYLDLGLCNNYYILLDSSAPLSYSEILNDFKTKPVGGHKWEWCREWQFPDNDIIYNGFVSESLEDLQIEKIDCGFPISKNEKSESCVRFMFAGQFTDKHYKNESHYPRSLANSLISISLYIKENKLPARIDLVSNYMSINNINRNIIYNPLNTKLKFIDRLKPDHWRD
jgi:hypothetical protein